jgi:predicted ATPase
LIGRQREVDELLREVRAGRLVTITGVGGVGKTRLAIELASRLLGDYPGGAFFAELASASSADGVWQAVLDAAGILNSGGTTGATSAQDQVVRFLNGRQALLVLDNCEHLIEECAVVVDTILDRCATAAIVTTTREPLSVEGERVWRAPSLAPESVDSDAVQLFLDRCDGASRQQFQAAQLDVILDICRHLDGIPLAIELAAAQTAHLSVEEIAEHLSDRFVLLTGGRRRVQRQQTLRAAVEWSHDLLPDAQRVLLRRLAVFPNWFDLAAAETVCRGGEDEPVMRSLAALVAKSLVVADVARKRYRLLETIRAYAEEQLVAAGEAETFREQHCAWVFAAIDRIAIAAGRTLDGVEATIELDDDLSTALTWSVARGELERAARAVTSGGTFWWFTGRSEDGLRWLDAVDAADLSPSDRAALLSLRAALLIGRGDHSAVLDVTRALREYDPDETSPERLQADVIEALMLLAAPGGRERIDDLIRRAAKAEDPYFVRQARDYRAHLTFVSSPAEAVDEWEELVASADPNRRGIVDFFALQDLAGGRHLLGDHEGTLAAVAELERRGFTISRGSVTGAADFLRSLALCGLDDVVGARILIAKLLERCGSGAPGTLVTDTAIAAAVATLAVGEAEVALRLLGAARGVHDVAVTPISFAIHRHYRSLCWKHFDPEDARRIYEEGRRADLLALVAKSLAIGPDS